MTQRRTEGLADANDRNLERQGAMQFKDTERSASLCAPEAVEEVGRTFANPAICIYLDVWGTRIFWSHRKTKKKNVGKPILCICDFFTSYK